MVSIAPHIMNRSLNFGILASRWLFSKYILQNLKKIINILSLLQSSTQYQLVWKNYLDNFVFVTERFYVKLEVRNCAMEEHAISSTSSS